jgi:hypothetical protein
MITTSHRIEEIATFLNEYRPLWEQRPFVGIPVPWEKEWPALSTLLRALSVENIEKAEADPVGFLCASEVNSTLGEKLHAYASVPTLISTPISLPPRPCHVDNLKWQQVVYFMEAIRPFRPPGVSRWIDWCAGKGHLGSLLEKQFRQPVQCLERNESLVTMGNRLAGENNITFYQRNVLTDDVSPFIDHRTAIVALHACGQLNARLFALAAASKPAFMAVVPCCYQRIDGMHFTALSNAGIATGLHFSRHQLRLPALDEVKSTAAKRRFRKREMAFRLGADLLLRHASGGTEYTPLGHIPRKIIRSDFREFARFAFKKSGSNLPRDVNWKQAEEKGWERQHLVSALSISRQLFRRVIETWLLLDRVAYLEENGYAVTYGTFCPGEATPRNLMLLATPDR